MMISEKTIKVKAFEDHDGRATCSFHVSKGSCVFLRDKSLGLFCTFTSLEIYRDKDGVGLPRPTEGCPLWTAIQLDGE